jgi:hypothetical protein
MPVLTPIEAIRTYVRWDVLVVFALIGALTAFELLGVFGQHFVTITAIIKAYLPIPIRVMVLAWLVWHFFVSDIIAR